MTPTQDTTALVAVEQRHRDAAADACAALYSPAKLQAMREGRCDTYGMVQAFARFEAVLSAPKQPLGDVEAMREECLRIAEDQRSVAYWNIEAQYRCGHNVGVLDGATKIADRIRALATPVAEQPRPYSPTKETLQENRALAFRNLEKAGLRVPATQPHAQIEALTAENARLRGTLTRLHDAVANAKHPQNAADFAMQAFVTVGPALEAARALIQTKDNDDAGR